MKMNTASSSGSRTLPGNTITNPKEGLKGITTQSGTAYQRLTIPTTSSPLVVERETKVTKDTVHPTNNGSTKDVQPSVVPTESLILNSEPVIPPIIEHVASSTSRYSANYNDMTANRIDIIDMAYEEYSQEVLSFSDVIASEAFLNDDPSLPPPNQGNYLPEVRKKLKIYEVKSDKSSSDEPPKVELKDLPPRLEYAFLEGDDKLPVIITKDLSVEEKTALKTDFEPAVQHQRRVNPKIHDVIKNEVLKLLDVGLIYPISDSPWLNEATRKDHFPLPFMDQMLERLAGNQYYCFLDGFFGYFQIPIDQKDQEKTIFTCPYETFAYRRMPFGLCNAPGTFQRCMMAIFHDMIEKTMEVFMDDFSVFRNSF
nr:reverse transcriptase domain-containing protein [Tanacetum cinerariifolium]